MTAAPGDRVVVAMSGGVDSTAAAVWLQRDGLDVIGATLRLWYCDDDAGRGSCCDERGVELARAACAALDIPHVVLDRQQPFEDEVLRPAWEAYAAGSTPSPCVGCNERIKLRAMEQLADERGAPWIATGHHARVEARGDHVLLRRGRDRDKDQTYFLFQLTERQRARLRLPVGDRTKAEVRALLRELGLPNATRAESQDACLAAGDEGFAEALRVRFDGVARPGPIVDEDGRVLGRHDGLHRFTVGQRRGLGVALGRPAYVLRLEPDRAAVVVTTDPARLGARALRASGARWWRPVADGARVQVQVRYRSAPVGGTVALLPGGRFEVRFDRAQRAVTPGQAAALYDGDVLVGGGWIEGPLRDGTGGAG